MLPSAQDDRHSHAIGRLRGFTKAHPLLIFYLLAFGISWAGFSPILARSFGVNAFRSPVWLACLVFPATAPALAAWFVTRLADEPDSGPQHLRANLRQRVAWPLWTAAVALPAVLLSSAEFLSRWLVPHRPPALPPATAHGLLLTAAMSLCANPWEEVGWRGFALPRLLAALPAVPAALFVGLLAALWHLPLFLWPASPMSTFPVVPWALSSLGESLILAWLYLRSGRRLAVVMLSHVAENIIGSALGVRSHAILAAVNLAAGAVLFLFATPLRRQPQFPLAPEALPHTIITTL